MMKFTRLEKFLINGWGCAIIAAVASNDAMAKVGGPWHPKIMRSIEIVTLIASFMLVIGGLLTNE
jgi:hypothetical protein